MDDRRCIRGIRGVPLVAGGWLAALSLAGLDACGTLPCGGREASDVAGTPNIESFYVIPQPLVNDPWTVVFGLDVTDTDGDLGQGEADFFLNDGKDPSPVQPLAEIFAQSNVAPSATQARLWMRLRFGDNLKDGTEAWLRVQLLDAAGHRSNCYSLRLHFDVEPLAQRSASVRLARVDCRRARGGSS